MICEGWEGNTVDGKFPLLEWLGGWADRCVFLTIRQGTQRANIKLVLASGDNVETQLSDWETAKALAHPFLVQLMETGRSTIHESDVVYLLTEKTDAFLSGVIPRKALGASEAKAILDPIIEALSFLHGKGLGHGNVKPSNIVQVGDQWKLASDEMAGVGEFAKAGRKLDGYDAPELAEGKLTPAADMWSLGIITVEAFAQRTPVWDRDAGANLGVPAGVMPEIFREMARGCLRWEPADRISIEEAKALLARYTPAETTEPVPAKAEPVPLPIESDAIFPRKSEERAKPDDSFRAPEPAEFAPRSRMFSNLEEEDEHTGRKGSFLAVILVLLAVVAVVALHFRERIFSAGQILSPPAQSRSTQPAPENAAKEPGATRPTPESGGQTGSPDQPQSAATSPPSPAASTAPGASPAPEQAERPQQQTPSAPIQPQPQELQQSKSPTQPPVPESNSAEPKPQTPSTRETNSRGAVLRRVLPNLEPGATGSMRRPLDIELRVSVDKEGKVSNVQYMTQGPGNYFARKAHQAAEAWRFTPPRSNGQAQASDWIVLFRFERHKVDATASKVR